jgi:threonine/homoserine/homoserine lactone efflux protein
MDFLFLLLKGLLIGLIIAFPCGPVGLIYIKRATTDGFFAGFFSGLGIVFADIFYAIALIFGYLKILTIFNDKKKILIIISSLFLIALGYIIFQDKHKKLFPTETKNPKTLLGFFLSSFFITIANPIVVVQFTFFFSLFKVFNLNDIKSYVFLISGIILCSLSWPILTSLILPKIGRRLPASKLNNFQKIIGLLIIFSGCVFALRTLI